MTPEKAKKLLPVIQAYAVGLTIQVRANKWEKWENATEHVTFYLEPECYRIKPEPIERWVNFYKYPNASHVHASRGDADKAADDRRIACIKVTFEEGEGL
jgi:hypothetical protein